jgi:hypothetical protein
MAPPEVASSALSAASPSSESGRYLLLGRGPSHRLERQVDALGGEFEFFDAPTGFGVIVGLGVSESRELPHRRAARRCDVPRLDLLLSARRVPHDQPQCGDAAPGRVLDPPLDEGNAHQCFVDELS